MGNKYSRSRRRSTISISRPLSEPIISGEDIINPPYEQPLEIHAINIEPVIDPRERLKAAREITHWEVVNKDEIPEDTCIICLFDLKEDYDEDNPIVILSECTGSNKHSFHANCIAQCFKDTFILCPVCQHLYGIRTGMQPAGTMTIQRNSKGSLPLDGYSNVGTIQINYVFPNGIQGPEHPHPGVHYDGTSRVAYLPDNEDGNMILGLFQTAWERRLLFRVGQSITTGQDNCVIWNGIHMKTATTGGPTNFGYPDETYFMRVMSELSDVGVRL